MVKVRAFIAVEFSGNSVPWISSVQAELSKLTYASNIRITPLKQIHLTLAFLGEIDSQLIPDLTTSLDNSKIHLPIPILFDRIGHFSRDGVVSIVWVGIRQNQMLEKIFADIQTIVSPLVNCDNGKHMPHLTLARVRPGLDKQSNARFISFLETKQPKSPIQDSIQEVILYKSELRPTGPIYTRLYTINGGFRIQ